MSPSRSGRSQAGDPIGVLCGPGRCGCVGSVVDGAFLRASTWVVCPLPNVQGGHDGVAKHSTGSVPEKENCRFQGACIRDC